MLSKPTYEELEKKIRELELADNDRAAEIERLRENLNNLQSESNGTLPKTDKIQVSGINIEWNTRDGYKRFCYEAGCYA